MSPEFPVSYSGHGYQFAVVVSRFNELVTSKLLVGAKDALLKHGVKEADIDVAWTPGAFEIPLVAKKLAESGKYSAVVCLGAVVKGDTSHDKYVADNAIGGIADVALQSGVPIILGILTTDNLEQAMDRAGGKAGNKGFDAALAALEMANLHRQIGGR